MEQLGYLGLFLASLLAGSVLPMSSEGVLLWLLYEEYNAGLCVLVATLGNTIGGISGYYLGFWASFDRIKRWLGISRDQIWSWEDKAKQYGSWLGLLTWLPFIGDPISVAMGLFRTKPWESFFFMALGKGVRYALMVAAYSSLT